MLGAYIKKHQRALDLIYKYRPDPRVAIRDVLTRLIKDTEGLRYSGTNGSRFIFFYPQDWNVPALNANADDSHGFFRFVFRNEPDTLTLLLESSPADENTRQRLYEMALRHNSVFNNPTHPDSSQWSKLHRLAFLTPEHYAGGHHS